MFYYLNVSSKNQKTLWLDSQVVAELMIKQNLLGPDDVAIISKLHPEKPFFS
jgi:hypothetical protein